MTKKKFSLEYYHEVFVPFPDVYHMGGSEVFTNLSRKISDIKSSSQKNLVVLPIGYSDKLGYLEENEQSEGSASALKFINSAKKESRPKNLSINGSNVTIYSVSEGLDLAFIDDEKFSHDHFNMADLGEVVKNFTKPTNPEKIPLKLITNRQSDHLKYNSRGFVVEEPEFLQVNEDIVNQGIITGPPELYAKLNENNRVLPLEEVVSILSGSKKRRELYMNQFIRFTGSHEFARVTGDLKYNKSGNRITGVDKFRVELLPHHDYNLKEIRIGNSVVSNVVGISPRDMEQKIALQYGIFNPLVPLLFIAGKRGSGKTILDFSGIDQVLVHPKDERERRGWPENGKGGLYKKVILIKAPEILGGDRRNIGFLPGNEFKKIKPHIQPYIDAHNESLFETLGIPFEDLIRHPKYDNDYGIRVTSLDKKIGNAHLPPNSEVVEVRTGGFLGGASLSYTLMFVDEAQDLTPYEMKTMIERMGEGSKLIISGDPAQTRNPYCSRKFNGFTFAIKHYLNKHYSMLIQLNKNYRHQMSEDTDDMNVQNPR